MNGQRIVTTMKEVRRQTANIPDDQEVIVCLSNDDDNIHLTIIDGHDLGYAQEEEL